LAEVTRIGTGNGFTLLELLIAVFLSTLLTTGIVKLISGSVSAYRLQISQSGLEESGHYARDVLVSHISQAGYQPKPWNDTPPFAALTTESMNSVSPDGDQLGLQRWSRQNCYGKDNPLTDDENQPAFHLLQSRFRVTSSNNLGMTCRYGPDDSQLVTQINNFGLVEDVESMQVLYAEDRNGDDIPDSWVTGQAWQSESNIRAVKLALLLSTRQPFDRAESSQITLLDETITTPMDGHLRKVASLTTAIRGRVR